MFFLMLNVVFMVIGQYCFWVADNVTMGWVMIVAQVSCLIGSIYEGHF